MCKPKRRNNCTAMIKENFFTQNAEKSFRISSPDSSPRSAISKTSYAFATAAFHSSTLFFPLYFRTLAAAAAAVLAVKKKKGTVPAGAENAQGAVQTAAKSAQAAAKSAAEELTPKPVKITCSCGAEFESGAKFCQRCGKPLMAPGRCPSCGYQNDPAAKFCQSCGKLLNGGEG